jgi:hypothetical protein
MALFGAINVMDSCEGTVRALMHENRTANIGGFFIKIIGIHSDEAISPVPTPSGADLAFDEAYFLACDLNGQGMKFAEKKTTVVGFGHRH